MQRAVSPSPQGKSIVVFTNTLLSGGAEKQAFLLALKLKDWYRVTLVVYYGDRVEGKYLEALKREQLRVTYLKGNTASKLVQFYRLLKRERVNILFSYLLTTNLVGAVVGILAKVPVRVGGIRNAKLDPKKIPLQRFITNHLCTHTIYNNFRGLEVLSALGFDRRKARVIPNCFEISTQPVTRPETDCPRIITVGRFVAQKGYFEALKAMHQLKKERVSFRYLIVGFGELEQQIRAEIDRLILQDEVELILNPSDINSYYRSADIYLCSSLFEGLSNTLMEAMSFSLPVVATDVGDNNRLVINAINGFLVNDGKSEFFVQALKQLLKSSELRNQMGLAGFEIIKHNYSASVFLDSYKSFIAET